MNCVAIGYLLIKRDRAFRSYLQAYLWPQQPRRWLKISNPINMFPVQAFLAHLPVSPSKLTSKWCRLLLLAWSVTKHDAIIKLRIIFPLWQIYGDILKHRFVREWQHTWVGFIRLPIIASRQKQYWKNEVKKRNIFIKWDPLYHAQWSIWRRETERISPQFTDQYSSPAENNRCELKPSKIDCSYL